MDVLVVGLGSMGKRRIRLMKRFSQIGKIVGIDSREDRRKDVQEKLDCDVCDSIDKALKLYPTIEAAFICTSPLSHSSLINSVLQHNLHVFTEINLVADGYEENMRLAKKKKRILFLSSTFYYREEIKYIRENIKDKNKLNYIYHIGQYLPDWHPWESFKDYFIGDKRTNGCRELMAIEFPWIVGTFGDVQNFNVLSDKITDLNISYKDNYMIQLQHENGNKGTLIIDVVSPKAVRNLEIYGDGVYYSWNGTPDTLEEFDVIDKKIQNVKLNELSEHIDGYSSFVIENAYQNEIKAFLDSISKDLTACYDFEDDIKILSLIDRIEGKNE